MDAVVLLSVSHQRLERWRVACVSLHKLCPDPGGSVCATYVLSADMYAGALADVPPLGFGDVREAGKASAALPKVHPRFVAAQCRRRGHEALLEGGRMLTGPHPLQCRRNAASDVSFVYADQRADLGPRHAENELE